MNAGRLGHRFGAEILEVTFEGTSSRRGSTCPATPLARVEVVDAAGRRAWTNPLWPPITRRRAAPPRATRSRQTAFDLLVIGGGVIGAATAAHAARAGLAVALVDAGDFGSGTSSASSKLVHGGLRYLRLGDVRLVREAHHERRTLAGRRRAAPRPSPPVPPPALPRRPVPARLRPERHPPLLDARALAPQLAGTPERASELVPSLRTDGLRSCALYADAWTNDARLCLENVLAAAEAGAVAQPGRGRVPAARGREVCGAEVRLDGEAVDVGARVTVNAAGPWVDTSAGSRTRARGRRCGSARAHTFSSRVERAGRRR